MPKYSYEAKDTDGTIVFGELEAVRVSDAIAQLEAQGLQVESIRATVTLPDLNKTKRAFYDRIDQALERRESLIPALEALADELPHRSAARDVQRFARVLREGTTAEQFVKKDETAAWLPLVVRGLDSSSTAERYGQLMDDATRESESRKNLRTVLAYPLFLLLFGGIILMFMVILVVPTFAKMFSEFGLILPAPTRVVFWISRQLTERLGESLLVILLALGVLVLLGRIWIHFALSTSVLGMFTAGSSANLTAMARFTSSLAELASIDAPLHEAIRIAGRACEHRHFRVMAERLATELESPGVRLRDTAVAHNFPSSVRYALACGSDGQPNVPLLRELATMYSERAQQRTSWSTSVLGPLSLFGLGLLVGFVLIALFLPLVSLVTALA